MYIQYLQYATFAWNFITSSDVCKLEHIQRSFQFSVIIVFFIHLDYRYGNVLNYLKLHTLSVWRRYLDFLFIADVLSGLKYCPTLLETVVPLVLNRNFRDFSLFNVNFKGRNCPCAGCVSAANTIVSDIDIFNRRSV